MYDFDKTGNSCNISCNLEFIFMDKPITYYTYMKQ